ncbi:MAG: hypothetical protein IJN05_09800 [Ruminococcus sp.]|nr:hypothetical protein [Ruminococcus sp.]
MDIREIEKIIDNHHKSHEFLSGSKEQLFYDALATFEDLCFGTSLMSILNPMMLKVVTDHMDSLNQALRWIEDSDLPSTENDINTDITEDRYAKCLSFLTAYAYRYQIICSGYISFSRNRLDTTIDNQTVTFIPSDSGNYTAWNDIIREMNDTNATALAFESNPIKIIKANAQLQESISIENGYLGYDLSNSIFTIFEEIAEKQWEITKTLPDTWMFNEFSILEYKKVWIAITTHCYVHFAGCSQISDPIVRLRNQLIQLPYPQYIDCISSLSGVNSDCVKRIIDYITFNPKKKNVDIMYQPIIVIKDMVLIAPILFMGSRPERNLLSVVSSRKDRQHSKEVNDLEDLMVSEIDESISSKDSLVIIKHKRLSSELPDIDYGIYDSSTNSVLLCEIKWFMAADSTKEVYAREDEVTHGCEQSETIMAYAMSDRAKFMKQVFNIDNCNDVELFCCVVVKHNIRTQNKHVPVINIKKLKELLSTRNINSVFHTIRDHEYEDELPCNAEITLMDVEYAGFTFKLPAIGWDSSQIT